MAISIQQKISIKDIKDGVVILESGALRAVLMVSSINFALKSTEEQDALTYKYQEFLNSLDFSVQILIASRQFDITDYVATLEAKQKEQTNELLKIQTSEYIEYIKTLTQMTNIMTESFYLIIPFASLEKKTESLLEKLTQPFKKTESVKQDFEQMKAQLWQRVEFVNSGLASMGLKVAPLNTEELIELYYSMYNLEAKEKPKITEKKEEQMIQ